MGIRKGRVTQGMQTEFRQKKYFLENGHLYKWGDVRWLKMCPRKTEWWVGGTGSGLSAMALLPDSVVSPAVQNGLNSN